MDLHYIDGSPFARVVRILWSQSRGPIAWRGRPRIASLVARLEDRPSFLQTTPRPHVLK